MLESEPGNFSKPGLNAADRANLTAEAYFPDDDGRGTRRNVAERRRHRRHHAKINGGLGEADAPCHVHEASRLSKPAVLVNVAGGGRRAEAAVDPGVVTAAARTSRPDAARTTTGSPERGGRGRGW